MECVVQMQSWYGLLLFQGKLPVRNQQICNRSATDLFCPKQINYRLIYYLHDLFSVCADEVNGSSATFFCLQT